MINSLRGYKIIKGTRGMKGINERKYAEIIVRLSTLLRFATEIKEMDINPLLADENDVIAVDARIRVEKPHPGGEAFNGFSRKSSCALPTGRIDGPE